MAREYVCFAQLERLKQDKRNIVSGQAIYGLRKIGQQIFYHIVQYGQQGIVMVQISTKHQKCLESKESSLKIWFNCVT